MSLLKYLKYKNKYFSLKNQLGGAEGAEVKPCQKWSAAVCICPKCAPERYKNLATLPDRDIFSHIIKILDDFSSNMDLLLVNKDMANNFDFKLLHSKIDSKFNFEPITPKLLSKKYLLFEKLMPEKQIIAGLYISKIRLIKIYNELIPDEKKRKVVDQVIFDENLIYHLLMKSIIFNYKTTEAVFRSNQDFLTSLLSPERVIKNIHQKMFWRHVSEENIIRIDTSRIITRMKLSKITIPNSVEIIDDEAFDEVHLENVSISNNVTHIGVNAFSNNLLQKVIIPDSVISIGAGAFNINRLTELYISKSVDEIDEFTFSNNLLKKVVIPDSVVSISKEAFSNNFLKRVTIPNSVILIGESAFENNKLRNVIIPDSVEVINRSAFALNESISKDGFPDKFKEDKIFN